MPRINLLKEKEIKAFDTPGILSQKQRNAVFTDEGIAEMGKLLRKPMTKMGFVLQRGYFILQKKFFVPASFHREDIEFVSKLFPSEVPLDLSGYAKTSYNRHRKIILERYGYVQFNEGRQDMENEARELVKTALRPREMFHALRDFLVERKIEHPKYYVFADIIRSSLNEYEQQLVARMEKELSRDQREMLDGLMSLPTNHDEISARNPYLLTKLKKPTQEVAPKKIKESLDDFKIISDLHVHFIGLIASLDISDELLNYYAVWVIKAEHVQFDSITDLPKKRIYLLAFIVYQFRTRQDFFVDTLLVCVKKYHNDTEKEVAKNFLDLGSKGGETKEKLSKIREIVLSSKKQLEKARGIVYSPNYQDSKKLSLLKDLLAFKEESFQDRLLSELAKLEKGGTPLRDRMIFDQLGKGYRKIHNRVGGILKVLEFNPETSDEGIMRAIAYFRLEGEKNGKPAPTSFLAEKDHKWVLNDNGSIDQRLYNVLLFRETAQHIKAGSLNLKFSDKYRSIDEYLISKERWETDRDKLLERSNISSLGRFEDFLLGIKKELDERFRETNEQVKDNGYLKFTRDGKPKVDTPTLETGNAEGLLHILGDDGFLPLIDLLSDVGQCTGLTSNFTHYNRKSSNKVPPDNIVLAGLMALGCNIGIRKMGKISKGIGAAKLDYAIKWHFGKENIDEANRRIISVTNELSLPLLFQKKKDLLHTSSDGQKFNVMVPSLNAAYSYKYFGFGKGVSAYSFIDEKSRLFYSTVISASEREAGYILDGLMHNEDVESDIHSTDTHGYSEIVFGICNALGIFFAPRIKNYKSQLLYTFKTNPRKMYEALNYRILPSKSLYIDETVLAEQWENILRLLCSIKLKEVKASEVLRRLGSYSKQHPLHRSLKNLGRIFKTIFLLRYINEVPLRQGIQKQLNRIEQSHQFANAVYFGKNQELNYSTKAEQEIAVSCRHLIQNAIVLWNYLTISQKLSVLKDEKEYNKLLNSIKSSSIMTWQHINMLGEYDFLAHKGKSMFDLEKLKEVKIRLE